MIELLSPAGNIEALKCAVANRTDAVYLGLEQFNARLKADNFSTQNIKEWVEFCHFYGVKVYVTINTLIKQKELCELDNLLNACKTANVDAIIVTDLAVVARAKKLCPNIPLHASTQMGVHNYLGAKMLEELGFSRVVLARECRLEDIREIKKHTNLELEYFVHGALCVAFSGQCLLSSMASGNSGNRGLCLQPCRKEYTESLTGKNGYMISPKDQCLIDYIDRLKTAGIDSLKIEGRLKSSEYVAVVTAKYRAAIDGKKITTQDSVELKRVFNRGGFSSGYAFSDKKQILCTNNQNHLGEKVGEVINSVKSKDYFKIEVKSSCKLNNGDGIKIFRKGKEVGGNEVSIIECKNNVYKLYSKYPFKKGDQVHITYDSNLSKQYLQVDLPKILLDLDVKIKRSQIFFSCQYKNIVIEYKENVNFDLSQNIVTGSDDVIESLKKTGGTPFEFAKVCVQMDEDLFLPKSTINGIRRKFIEYLKVEIAKVNTSLMRQTSSSKTSKTCEYSSLNLRVKNTNPSNIVIADKLPFDDKIDETIIKIVLNYNNFDQKVINYAQNHNNLFVKLPKIAMQADLKIILEFEKNLPKNVGIYADSLWQYYLGVLTSRPIIGGLGLNLFNSEAVDVLGLKSFVFSPELCKSEIEDFNMQSSVFSFGYLPIMNFCHCPVQHFTGCSCADCKYKEYSLTDKYGDFKVRRVKVANCYFEMLNSSCHLIEFDWLPSGCFACLDVTEFENSSEIINNYLNNSCYFLSNSIKLTRGQFARGVK